MTKQQAIYLHQELVAQRPSYVKASAEASTQDLPEAQRMLKETDREISQLGQAHNARISAKAREALNLQD